MVSNLVGRVQRQKREQKKLKIDQEENWFTEETSSAYLLILDKVGAIVHLVHFIAF